VPGYGRRYVAKEIRTEMIANIDDAKTAIIDQRRDAIVAADTKSTQNLADIQSCYGGVFHGRQGERWPTNNGLPIIPWLQIVSRDLPFRLPPFDKLEMVAFFIDPNTWEPDFGEPDHHPIVVREYSLLDDLHPLARPKELSGHPYYSLTWNVVSDHPSLSHFYESFDNTVYDAMCDSVEQLGLDNHTGIKIGGWPSLVQRDYDLLMTESYVMQIDMTENYMYGDSGVAYVDREKDGRWSVDFDCC